MTNLDLAYQQAMDHLSRSGFEALSPLDQDLVSIWNWTAAVSNGGFAHLYKSKEGDTAFHAPQAMRRIGANQTAAIAEVANAAFGPSGPPKLKAERVVLLDKLMEQQPDRWDDLEWQFNALEEDCDELFEQFLNSGSTP